MGNSNGKLLSMFVLNHSGCGYTLVTSLKKWKVLFLQLKNRLCLLMLLKHLFTEPHVQLGAGCATFDETIDHFVSCCSVLVQSEYKSRHDHVASHIHWMLVNRLDSQ